MSGSLNVRGFAGHLVALNGIYEKRTSDNHGKAVYHKQTSSPVDGQNTSAVYYWDKRDGESLSGWWMAPVVGGEQVWAFTPVHTPDPPKSGWKVPWHAQNIDPNVHMEVQRNMGGYGGGQNGMMGNQSLLQQQQQNLYNQQQQNLKRNYSQMQGGNQNAGGQYNQGGHQNKMQKTDNQWGGNQNQNQWGNNSNFNNNKNQNQNQKGGKQQQNSYGNNSNWGGQQQQKGNGNSYGNSNSGANKGGNQWGGQQNQAANSGKTAQQKREEEEKQRSELREKQQATQLLSVERQIHNAENQSNALKEEVDADASPSQSDGEQQQVKKPKFLALGRVAYEAEMKKAKSAVQNVQKLIENLQLGLFSQHGQAKLLPCKEKIETVENDLIGMEIKRKDLAAKELKQCKDRLTSEQFKEQISEIKNIIDVTKMEFGDDLDAKYELPENVPGVDDLPQRQRQQNQNQRGNKGRGKQFQNQQAIKLTDEEEAQRQEAFTLVATLKEEMERVNEQINQKLQEKDKISSEVTAFIAEADGVVKQNQQNEEAIEMRDTFITPFRKEVQEAETSMRTWLNKFKQKFARCQFLAQAQQKEQEQERQRLEREEKIKRLEGEVHLCAEIAMVTDQIVYEETEKDDRYLLLNSMELEGLYAKLQGHVAKFEKVFEESRQELYQSQMSRSLLTRSLARVKRAMCTVQAWVNKDRERVSQQELEQHLIISNTCISYMKENNLNGDELAQQISSGVYVKKETDEASLSSTADADAEKQDDDKKEEEKSGQPEESKDDKKEGGEGEENKEKTEADNDKTKLEDAKNKTNKDTGPKEPEVLPEVFLTIQQISQFLTKQANLEGQIVAECLPKVFNRARLTMVQGAECATAPEETVSGTRFALCIANCYFVTVRDVSFAEVCDEEGNTIDQPGQAMYRQQLEQYQANQGRFNQQRGNKGNKGRGKNNNFRQSQLQPPRMPMNLKEALKIEKDEILKVLAVEMRDDPTSSQRTQFQQNQRQQFQNQRRNNNNQSNQNQQPEKIQFLKVYHASNDKYGWVSFKSANVRSGLSQFDPLYQIESQTVITDKLYMKNDGNMKAFRRLQIQEYVEVKGFPVLETSTNLYRVRIHTHKDDLDGYVTARGNQKLSFLCCLPASLSLQAIQQQFNSSVNRNQQNNRYQPMRNQQQQNQQGQNKLDFDTFDDACGYAQRQTLKQIKKDKKAQAAKDKQETENKEEGAAAEGETKPESKKEDQPVDSVESSADESLNQQKKQLPEFDQAMHDQKFLMLASKVPEAFLQRVEEYTEEVSTKYEPQLQKLEEMNGSIAVWNEREQQLTEKRRLAQAEKDSGDPALAAAVDMEIQEMEKENETSGIVQVQSSDIKEGLDSCYAVSEPLQRIVTVLRQDINYAVLELKDVELPQEWQNKLRLDRQKAMQAQIKVQNKQTENANAASSSSNQGQNDNEDNQEDEEPAAKKQKLDPNGSQEEGEQKDEDAEQTENKKEEEIEKPLPQLSRLQQLKYTMECSVRDSFNKLDRNFNNLVRKQGQVFNKLEEEQYQLIRQEQQKKVDAISEKLQVETEQRTTQAEAQSQIVSEKLKELEDIVKALQQQQSCGTGATSSSSSASGSSSSSSSAPAVVADDGNLLGKWVSLSEQLEETIKELEQFLSEQSAFQMEANRSMSEYSRSFQSQSQKVRQFLSQYRTKCNQTQMQCKQTKSRISNQLVQLLAVQKKAIASHFRDFSDVADQVKQNLTTPYVKTQEENDNEQQLKDEQKEKEAENQKQNNKEDQQAEGNNNPNLLKPIPKKNQMSMSEQLQKVQRLAKQQSTFNEKQSVVTVDKFSQYLEKHNVVQSKLILESVFTEVSGRSDCVDEDDFATCITGNFYRCINNVIITDQLSLISKENPFKKVRNLDFLETVQILEEQLDENKLRRGRIRCLGDKTEGWVTIQGNGNPGKVFLEPVTTPFFVNGNMPSKLTKELSFTSEAIGQVEQGDICKIIGVPELEAPTINENGESVPSATANIRAKVEILVLRGFHTDPVYPAEDDVLSGYVTLASSQSQTKNINGKLNVHYPKPNEIHACTNRRRQKKLLKERQRKAQEEREQKEKERRERAAKIREEMMARQEAKKLEAEAAAAAKKLEEEAEAESNQQQDPDQEAEAEADTTLEGQDQDQDQDMGAEGELGQQQDQEEMGEEQDQQQTEDQDMDQEMQQDQDQEMRDQEGDMQANDDPADVGEGEDEDVGGADQADMEEQAVEAEA